MKSFEKEENIKQANHRVKNNLQLINSLLNYQAIEYKSEDVDRFISKGQKRINSIILLHENFDLVNDKNKVNVKKYITDLFHFFTELFEIERKNIIFEMEVNDIQLEMESALPLGIMLNELICNSLLHAFPKNTIKDKIKIQLTRLNKNNYELIYEDNGIGYPNTTKNGLGLKIIEMLSKQLNAKYVLESDNGFKFKLTFYSQ